MASYKVPQDVEAEDKLLGPLSFRQFIYLIIAVMFGALAYFLAMVFMPLLIIPAPFAIGFLILALPLKKDQPIEVYLIALLSFYFKPRRKLWEQDGIMTLVEFTNEIPSEQNIAPDITFEQAKQQINFLSSVVDSNGMIIRNQLVANPAIQSEVLAEARQVEDIHDESATINQKFDQIINQQNQVQRQQIIQNIQTSNTQDTYLTPSNAPNVMNNFDNLSQYQTEIAVDTASEQPFKSANSSVNIKPSNTPKSSKASTTEISDKKPYAFSPSPDIINLANNDDLSIQTIASEAKKINQRHKLIDGENEEVVISLK